MGNMSYCRFQNTLRDLQEVARHAFDEDLSPDEDKARRVLLKECVKLADELGMDGAEIDLAVADQTIKDLPNGDDEENEDEEDDGNISGEDTGHDGESGKKDEG